MQKKAVKDNAKKSKILSAAANCFMTDGFEGTSIRQIMNEAGAEVGQLLQCYGAWLAGSV